MGPQLGAGKSPVSGIPLGHIQDNSSKTAPPSAGMHGDHRDVGKPRQRIRTGTILIESLQHEHHRNQFPVVDGKYRECRWPSKPAMNLVFCPSDIFAGHRAQR